MEPCSESSANARTLTRQELAETWKEYLETRAEEPRNRLIDNYIHLVGLCTRKIAKSFPGPIDADGLFQAMRTGLVNAVEQYRPQYGTDLFDMVLWHHLRTAVLDYLRSLPVNRLPRQLPMWC